MYWRASTRANGGSGEPMVKRASSPERRHLSQQLLHARTPLTRPNAQVVAAVLGIGALGEDLGQRVGHAHAVSPVGAAFQRWRRRGNDGGYGAAEKLRQRDICQRRSESARTIALPDRHAHRHPRSLFDTLASLHLDRIPQPNVNQRPFCTLLGASSLHNDTFPEGRLVVSANVMRAVERGEETGEAKRGMHGEEGSAEIPGLGWDGASARSGKTIARAEEAHCGVSKYSRILPKKVLGSSSSLPPPDAPASVSRYLPRGLWPPAGAVCAEAASR